GRRSCWPRTSGLTTNISRSCSPYRRASTRSLVRGGAWRWRRPHSTLRPKSYESPLASYTPGLSTLVELLAARRELSRAQFTALDTKVRVLIASAALAFASGDLGQE